mmetsp:Transcript_20681/g.61682  ORF Transcript_20681/g.61682 Transcript_20681/m.61682 type:complete len:217 (+) Transcript_20681:154-804(+)
MPAGFSPSTTSASRSMARSSAATSPSTRTEPSSRSTAGGTGMRPSGRRSGCAASPSATRVGGAQSHWWPQAAAQWRFIHSRFLVHSCSPAHSQQLCCASGSLRDSELHAWRQPTSIVRGLLAHSPCSAQRPHSGSSLRAPARGAPRPSASARPRQRVGAMATGLCLVAASEALPTDARRCCEAARRPPMYAGPVQGALCACRAPKNCRAGRQAALH